jgi:hypothetical protein
MLTCSREALEALLRGDTSECRVDKDLILLYESFRSTQELKYLDIAVELVETSRAADSSNRILGLEHLLSHLQSLRSGSRVVFLTISISPCIMTTDVCGEAAQSAITSESLVDTYTLKWDQLEIFLFPGFERLKEAELLEISHSAIQKELSNLPIGHHDRRRLFTWGYTFIKDMIDRETPKIYGNQLNIRKKQTESNPAPATTYCRI